MAELLLKMTLFGSRQYFEFMRRSFCKHRNQNVNCFQKSFHCGPKRFNVMTMEEVKEDLTKKMGVPLGYTLTPPDRSHLLKYLVKSQDELPTRSMKDSFAMAVIPLSGKPKLQDHYSTVTGKLRMGRVMEDMDYFAVYVALKYIKNPKTPADLPSPYTIVTAAVDEIEFTFDKPPVSNDVRISGKVVTVGRSSLDVCVELERKMPNGTWEKMTVSYFSMVARNATLTGPAIVNKMKPDGIEEEKELALNLERRERKKAADKLSLLKYPPTFEEQKLIHENFMKSVDINDPTLNKRLLPPGAVWMEDTQLTSCLNPHPDNRNHQGTVFGGYLMRVSLELAFMTVLYFSNKWPSLRFISNITFRKPVYLSSFLKVKSEVVYTYQNYMEITVFIELLDLKTRESQTTHSLHFTYEIPEPCPPVAPKTYHDAITMLQGRREMFKFMEKQLQSLYSSPHCKLPKHA